MRCVQNVVRRSYCLLHNQKLYSQTYTGRTKVIIDEFYAKLKELLNKIANTTSYNTSLRDKIQFFNSCKLSYDTF